MPARLRCCHHCGRDIHRLRRRDLRALYCSDRCKNRARRRRTLDAMIAAHIPHERRPGTLEAALRVAVHVHHLARAREARFDAAADRAA